MNPLNKTSFWIVLSFCWASLALAAPPPLPLAGDLTDQSGQPLNETVMLTFSLSNSANDNELWSEVHDDVSVVQGRFAVLLGVKKDLLNSDGSAMDFTQKKYIKVQITRKDQQEPYTLTPPLEYIPTLGAWQAKYADEAKNASKLESKGWKDIEGIERSFHSELEKLKEELDNTKKQLEDTKQQFNSNLSAVQTSLNTFQTNSLVRLNQLDDFVSAEKAAIKVTFVGGQYGNDCPNGWTNQGEILLIHKNGEAKTLFYAQGAGLIGSPGWSWTHTYLCRRNGY